MKKYQSETIICILLILTLLCLISISSTYAKYTKEIVSKANTVVAKLDVNGPTSTTFKLFDTIYEENGMNSDTIETNVAKGKIAPGVEGKVDLYIRNKSEVTLNARIKFYENGKDNPNLPKLQYSIDGKSYVSDITRLGFEYMNMNPKYNWSNTNKKIGTIYWKWPYEGDDAADTSLGFNPEDLTITVTTTFTQIN